MIALLQQITADDIKSGVALYTAILGAVTATIVAILAVRKWVIKPLESRFSAIDESIAKLSKAVEGAASKNSIESVEEDWAEMLLIVERQIKELLASERREREEADRIRDAADRDLRTSVQTWLAHVDRIKALEVKMDVFWKMIEKSTSEMLHRDDTPDIDRLLEKLPDHQLSSEEEIELIGYLERIEHDNARSRADHVAAILLRAAMTARRVGRRSG